jgi:flagellar motor switch protein FliG
MATSEESLRKAAVLLRSLSKPQRTRLLDRLEPQQAAAVTAEMNGLGHLSQAEQEAVVREFARASAARSGKRRPPSNTPFHFLQGLDTNALLALIAGEHPQAIALVLCQLPPELAGKVLDKLTPEEQLSAICRIAAMSEPSPEVMEDVQQGLKRRLLGDPGRSGGKHGITSVVRILNVMEPAVERRLLRELADADPELVRSIRRAMFGADVAACEEWAVAEAAC